ncbi:MAG: TrmH family RNA methyltransferase [Treponema sp.]|nr:TrmH family RNA methyltransferase [Spirochaetia bacterium]MDD7014147.1 TrmH family RNA methyltransferase [Spirochaetales bacterium]MDY4902031.1 TrmH family RNA methyltransferase [Treponema sp.]
MIDPNKLFQLSAGQKRRKLALTFGELERDIAGIAEKGTAYNFTQMTRQEYTKAVAKIVLEDPKLPADAALELEKLISANPFDERRTCNFARNTLLSIIGTFPAEWDLIIAPHSQEKISIEKRNFFPGVCVYAEDIRSPFNVGSIFRTAEAMGCEKVYISPNCTNPEQTKAVRSGMGCIETLGYTRCSLDELPADKPVFVLETGGTPIKEFKFPKEGIVIIGSEELGVSPEALKRATAGTVSIPMTGLKASLNVGVAFGILMQEWICAIQEGRATCL